MAEYITVKWTPNPRYWITDAEAKDLYQRIAEAEKQNAELYQARAKAGYAVLTQVREIWGEQAYKYLKSKPVPKPPSHAALRQKIHNELQQRNTSEKRRESSRRTRERSKAAIACLIEAGYREWDDFRPEAAISFANAHLEEVAPNVWKRPQHEQPPVEVVP